MQRRKTGQLRIIAGHWRGRRLRFPASGVRPTPDRVRETLFNWLAPVIDGARCLDLYAGSGALGLEAISRGASAVTFVEIQTAASDGLRDTLESLDAAALASASVVTGKASRFVESTDGVWDIVFIDPPFHENLACDAARRVMEHGLLSPDGLIYLETERNAPMTEIRNLELLREKHHGASTSRLLQHTA